MRAIEFIAKAKDGIIEIPKEYIKNLENEVRVIILVEAKTEKKAKKKKLTALSIKTKNLKFDRDEANER